MHSLKSEELKARTRTKVGNRQDCAKMSAKALSP